MFKITVTEDASATGNPRDCKARDGSVMTYATRERAQRQVNKWNDRKERHDLRGYSYTVHHAPEPGNT